MLNVGAVQTRRVGTIIKKGATTNMKTPPMTFIAEEMFTNCCMVMRLFSML